MHRVVPLHPGALGELAAKREDTGRAYLSAVLALVSRQELSLSFLPHYFHVLVALPVRLRGTSRRHRETRREREERGREADLAVGAGGGVGAGAVD